MENGILTKDQSACFISLLQPFSQVMIRQENERMRNDRDPSGFIRIRLIRWYRGWGSKKPDIYGKCPDRLMVELTGFGPAKDGLLP